MIRLPATCGFGIATSITNPFAVPPDPSGTDTAVPLRGEQVTLTEAGSQLHDTVAGSIPTGRMSVS
jgi:hypothetical protein